MADTNPITPIARPIFCSVCAHPHVADINRRIQSGEPPVQVAALFPPLTHMAVYHHRRRHILGEAKRTINPVPRKYERCRICAEQLATPLFDWAGKSMDELAALFGVERRQVERHVYRHAKVRLSLPKPKYKCLVCEHPDVAALNAKFIGTLCGYAEIANAVGCAKGTVSRHVAHTFSDEDLRRAAVSAIESGRGVSPRIAYLLDGSSDATEEAAFAKWSVFRKGAWHRANRDRRLREQRDRRQARRAQVIREYGGECACCGEKTGEFLSLDHVDNDGAAHRREITGSRWQDTGRVGAGDNTYRWVIANGFPKDRFQLLCFNCNFAKARTGTCPHKSGKGMAQPDSPRRAPAVSSRSKSKNCWHDGAESVPSEEK